MGWLLIPHGPFPYLLAAPLAHLACPVLSLALVQVRKGEARDVAQDDDGLITSGPDMFRLNCYDGANDPRHPNYTGPEVGRAGGLHGGF